MLVSIFILAVGLLGVAALIPIGKLALIKTNVSDRTGACGRAAMRDVEVRRMLDYSAWFPAVGSGNTVMGAIALDPLGCLGVGGNLGGASSTFPRYTFNGTLTQAQADAIFRWSDDLIFTMPEDMSPPQQGDRPVPVVVGGNPQSEGNFSWFLTVCPSPSDINMIPPVPVGLRRNYTVSVVVCYKRDFTGGEYATTMPIILPGGGYGGGTVQLNLADIGIIDNVKTDQWVMLVGRDLGSGVPVVAKWYRVVGVFVGSTVDSISPHLSLVGPDWDTNCFGPNIRTDLVVVEGVTGVYTTTVHLDADCIWTR